MEQFSDTITDRAGNALPGIAVLILTEAGIPATLYREDGGSIIANPVTSDMNGLITFAAANGTYSGITQSLAIVPDKEIPEFTLYDPDNNDVAVINVKDKPFGAVGDGIADDTVAIQLAWIAAGTRNLLLPAGTYRITAPLVGPLIMIEGAGQGRTVLDFENFAGEDGITFTAPATYDRQGGLSGMTIRAKGASGRHAVVTPRGSTLNNWRAKYTFQNLAFTGTANAAGFAQNFGWTWMMDVGDGWGTEIENIDAIGTYIVGNNPATQPEQGFLRLAGGQGLLSVRMRNITTHNCKYGIEIGDRVFWYINDTDIAESYKGIYSNRSDATTIYGEGVLQGVIINAQYRGIDLEDRIATMCNHVTINRSNAGFDHGMEWIGFRLEDWNLCNLNNIKIYAGFKAGGGRFAGQHVGIDIVGGQSLNISNYTPQALDRCIRTSTSIETTDIPSGITIAGVAAETSVSGSAVFDFQTARAVEVMGVTWDPAFPPGALALYGDATTARNVRIKGTRQFGMAATVGVSGAADYITDYGAGLNGKLYAMVNDNGNLRMQGRSDDELTATNWLLVNRNGMVFDQVELRATGLKFNGTLTGFYGATPVAKPVLTGSRAGNTALASVAAALAAVGLAIDNTTA